MLYQQFVVNVWRLKQIVATIFPRHELIEENTKNVNLEQKALQKVLIFLPCDR